MVLGHVDAAAGLLADSVDLTATLADDVAVSLGIGQDQVAGCGLGGRHGDGLFDDRAGLGYVLWGAGEDPGEGLGGRVGGDIVVDDLPGVGVAGCVGVVDDKGHVGSVGIAGFFGGGVDRDGLAGVVDCYLVVVTEAAEDLAVIGDGVVQVAGDVNRLGVLVLQHGLEVLLGAFDGSAGSLELDVGAARALLGDVQGDVELGLDAATGFAATADQHAVLGSGDLKDFGDLVLTLLDECLNGSDDVVNDRAIALKADGRLGALRTREADHSGGTAVVGATGVDNDLTDVGTDRKSVTGMRGGLIVTYRLHRSKPCGTSCRHR